MASAETNSELSLMTLRSRSDLKSRIRCLNEYANQVPLNLTSVIAFLPLYYSNNANEDTLHELKQVFLIISYF